MKFFKPKGFSTLELMIAFALMSIIFTGVILAHFGSSYWAVAAQTSNEGLYKAKTRLEELRAVVRKDFRLASSSVTAKVLDASCSAGGLCYYVTTKVEDLSSCSKYVTAQVDWRVQGYPTTTTSLFTNLTDTNEAIQLGGDCPLMAPSGAWATLAASPTFPSNIAGNPRSIDELGGVVYVATDATPYLQIIKNGSLVSFTNSFALPDAVNSIDVARDLTTGQTYAFLAMASTTKQFAVVNVTNPEQPELLASLQLQGVSGISADGWRVVVYGQQVYITVRDSAGAELHIIRADTPSNPTEYASPLNLDTSVYDFVVRDQKIGNTVRRFIFAATTLDAGEVKVLEVTNPTLPSVITTLNLPNGGCSLADEPGGKAAFVSGNTLLVGREYSAATCSSLPNLYAINISNPLSPYIVSSVVTGSGGVQGLRASGELVYALLSSQATPEYGNLLDMAGDNLYIAKNATTKLQVWKIANGVFSSSPFSSYSMSAAKLQSVHSQ